MFAFITISNGVVVVQHAPTGEVYRFRPVQAAVWSRLTLDKVDARESDHSEPERHAAALAFAQAAAAECWQTAFEHQASLQSCSPDDRVFTWRPAYLIAYLTATAYRSSSRS